MNKLKYLIAVVVILLSLTPAFGISTKTGTIVSAGITVGDNANTFASGFSEEIQGSYKVADDEADRLSITAARRVEGMVCYQIDTNLVYRLVGGIGDGNWAVDTSVVSLWERDAVNGAIYPATLTDSVIIGSSEVVTEVVPDEEVPSLFQVNYRSSGLTPGETAFVQSLLINRNEDDSPSSSIGALAIASNDNGWSVATPNLTENGTLELWDDAFNPTDWDIFTVGSPMATPATLEQESVNVYAGTYSGKMFGTTDEAIILAQLVEDVVEGAEYTVTFYGSAESAPGNICAIFWDAPPATATEIYNFTNEEWDAYTPGGEGNDNIFNAETTGAYTQFSVTTFEAPAANQIYIGFSVGFGNTHTEYIDNIAISETVSEDDLGSFGITFTGDFNGHLLGFNDDFIMEAVSEGTEEAFDLMFRTNSSELAAFPGGDICFEIGGGQDGSRPGLFVVGESEYSGGARFETISSEGSAFLRGNLEVEDRMFVDNESFFGTDANPIDFSNANIVATRGDTGQADSDEHVIVAEVKDGIGLGIYGTTDGTWGFQGLYIYATPEATDAAQDLVGAKIELAGTHTNQDHIGINLDVSGATGTGTNYAIKSDVGVIAANGGLRSSGWAVGGILGAFAPNGDVVIAAEGTDYQGAITFQDGVIEESSVVRLGGTLTETRTTTLGAYDLAYDVTDPNGSFQILGGGNPYVDIGFNGVNVQVDAPSDEFTLMTLLSQSSGAAPTITGIDLTVRPTALGASGELVGMNIVLDPTITGFEDDTFGLNIENSSLTFEGQAAITVSGTWEYGLIVEADAGNVGIGDPTPDTLFDVEDETARTVAIGSFTAGAGAAEITTNDYENVQSILYTAADNSAAFAGYVYAEDLAEGETAASFKATGGETGNPDAGSLIYGFENTLATSVFVPQVTAFHDSGVADYTLTADGDIVIEPTSSTDTRSVYITSGDVTSGGPVGNLEFDTGTPGGGSIGGIINIGAVQARQVNIMSGSNDAPISFGEGMAFEMDTTSGSITTDGSYFYIGSRDDAGARTITLADNTIDNGRTYIPYDYDGDADVYPIALSPATKLISGVADLYITQSFGSAIVVADENADGWVAMGDHIYFCDGADQSMANDGAITCGDKIERVVGNGGAVILDTDPAINDGKNDGQTCIIQGTHDTNTVTINDGDNVELSSGVDMTLGKGDTLMVTWDSGESTWYEISRSDN